MRYLLVCTTLLLSAANAQATGHGSPGKEDLPLWEMKLAGFGRVGAAYPASEETETNVFPAPFPIYRGKFLRLGDDTEKPVQTRIFARDRLKIDIDFGFNFPADSDDIDVREDMPDLDPLVEAGPELQYQFADKYAGGDLYFAAQARGAWAMDGLEPGSKGSIFTTELRYEKFFPKSKLVIKLQPEWADGDYMEYFYEVDDEFVTAERPAYEAHGGYLGTKFGFSLSRQITDDFELIGGARFGNFKGARNDDSPLYTDKTTAGVFLAFLWKFWESEARATAE